MEADPVIRPAEPRDLPAITTIYNTYIVDSHVSFDIEPWTVEQRQRWFERYGKTGRYRCLVADVAGAGVVGTAYSSDFRAKVGYQSSAQSTVVLDAAWTRRGIGTRLLRSLLDILYDEDIHRVYAIVALPNDASLQLHTKLGFESIGVQHESGFKLGRYWSTELLELRMDDHRSAPG